MKADLILADYYQKIVKIIMAICAVCLPLGNHKSAKICYYQQKTETKLFIKLLVTKCTPINHNTHL
jgi:hypothetical protein